MVRRTSSEILIFIPFMSNTESRAANGANTPRKGHSLLGSLFHLLPQKDYHGKGFTAFRKRTIQYSSIKHLLIKLHILSINHSESYRDQSSQEITTTYRLHFYLGICILLPQPTLSKHLSPLNEECI